MVDSCCAPGCQNRRGDGKGRAFYRIPKDPERRQRWISAIKRGRSGLKKSERWEPSKNGFRLCSEHFISGKKSDNPLSPDYVPSIFKHVPSPERRRRARQLDMFNRRQKRKLHRIELARKSSAAAVIPPTDCPQDGSSIPAEVGILTAAPPCTSEHCKRHVQSLELECQALRTENMLLKDKMNRIGLNEMSLQNNDKKVNILTGLPTFSLLMTLFNFVAPFLRQKSGLTLFQQYMLTLIKLKMNLSFDFLAYYFATDSATISTLFKNCISVMYSRLVPSFVIWPDRESLRKSLPLVFRNTIFENTVCIIDCFEIFIESHHATKYIMAICPQGTICFISNGLGGCTSDRFITEQSNILCNLLPGDLVLTDRGLHVTDSEHSYQAEIKISAFTRGKNQLDPVYFENTGCLASLRMHIEGVIGVLHQKYTVLQSTVPIGFTDIDKENVTYLDKIVSVCCALTNVSESVNTFSVAMAI